MRELNIQNEKVIFSPGVTVITGCKGSGKTLTMKNIIKQLEESEMSYLDGDFGNELVLHNYGRTDEIWFLFYNLEAYEGDAIRTLKKTLLPEIGRDYKGCKVFVLVESSDYEMCKNEVCFCCQDATNYVFPTRELFDDFMVYAEALKRKGRATLGDKTL